MERREQGEWSRREEVAGPTNRARVEVNLEERDDGLPRMSYRVRGEKRWIDGYSETITFKHEKCEWEKIEGFLERFRHSTGLPGPHSDGFLQTH